MRIGLLICDHVTPELLPVSGDYEDMFRRLFSSYEDLELIAYDCVNGDVPSSPFECDGWITTGSRYSVNDDAGWIDDLQELIRSTGADGPRFVGVCFGHQLLARAFGGVVGPSATGWSVGVKEIELEPGAPFDSSSVGRLRVFNSNREQIISLPPGAEVIAWRNDTPVAMMLIGDSMLGIQGHPEIDMRYGRALIESRRGSVVPQDTADVALSTLSHGSDSEVLAAIIHRFLRGDRGAIDRE